MVIKCIIVLVSSDIWQ